MARQIARDPFGTQDWTHGHKVFLADRDLTRAKRIETHQWCTDEARPGEYVVYHSAGTLHPKYQNHTVYGFSDKRVAFEFKLRFG